MAYRVERLLPRAQKTRGIQGMRSAMVGRENEMEVLQHALNKVLGGSGQLVVIMGEAGVGKSRLVEEFSQQAWRTVGMDGLRWLEGRCLELSKDVSYWPFLDLMKVDLGWLAQDESQENLAQVEKAVRRLVSSKNLAIESGKEIEAVLYHLLSLRSEPCGEDPLADLSPDEIRQRSFLALRDYLLALARSQPLALIFEDLHWADPLSLDLIYFLMESLSQARILWIVVYRPGQEYRTHHFLTVAGQKCHQSCTEIYLRDLSQEQSTQMIHFLLGGESHGWADDGSDLGTLPGQPILYRGADPFFN